MFTCMQVVEEYKQALPVYENFYQKRAAQKLRKLLADKAALPIAGFEGAIIDALRTSPAIVVAGDTGVTHKGVVWAKTRITNIPRNPATGRPFVTVSTLSCKLTSCQ